MKGFVSCEYVIRWGRGPPDPPLQKNYENYYYYLGQKGNTLSANRLSRYQNRSLGKGKKEVCAVSTK